jgi:hypothetical protein
MIAALRDRFDAFFGRGRFSTSVPVMDGPLQPNQLLEEAEVVVTRPALDNLASVDGAVLFSSGEDLFRLPRGAAAPEPIWRAPAPISCVAVDGAGAMAIGVDGVGIDIRGGRHDGRQIRTFVSGPLVCPTAALFVDEDTLIVALGSAEFEAAEWKRDLMSRGRSGSVWRVDLAGGKAELVAGGLAFPYGVARAPGNDILISEAWEHRIVRLGSQPGPHVVLDGLPGYPARLIAASTGGYWLCVFAPRNQLVEFVLKERDFCGRMMADVPPNYWIAPALVSGASFKEPLQGGGVKQMGILKPWAPARSYGLVVELDRDVHPVRSWHSRADGKMHGVSSACEHGGRLIAGAKGPGYALDLGAVQGFVAELA